MNGESGGSRDWGFAPISPAQLFFPKGVPGTWDVGPGYRLSLHSAFLLRS